ncbi:hypothetical protein ACM66B_004455 [Microbotryomycetes sp. NB124-2]
MAASFVGLPVSCRLRTGATIQGTVTALDVSLGTISLRDTVVTFGGTASQAGSRSVGDWIVNRSDIVQLQVVSVPSTSTQEQTQTAATQATTTTRQQQDQTHSTTVTPTATHRQQFPSSLNGQGQAVSIPSTASASPAPSPSRTRATSKAKHKQAMVHSPNEVYTSDDQSQKPTRRKQKKAASQGRAGQPATANSLEQDFDFGAGLRSFDKKAVFEQIRSQDQTDPASRLVSHNKRHAHNPYMSKLASNESVLSERELLDQQEDNAQALEALSLKRDGSGGGAQAPDSSEVETEDDEEYTTGTESQSEQVGQESSAMTESDSDFDVVVDRRPYLSSRRSTIKPGSMQDLNEFKTTSSRMGFKTDEDVRCSPITLKQFREALSIADIETGPTLVQRTEMAGLGIALFVLRHLSLDVGQSPEVCILCGESSEKAETALRAGVMLLNRGGRVTTLLSRSNAPPTIELREGLRVFSSAGGRIIRDLADISKSTSLVIDALSPCMTSSSTSSTTTSSSPLIDANLLSYLSGANSPAVLSIDSATGTDHDTGAELKSQLTHEGQTRALSPTYIVCRGSLRQGALRLFDAQRQAAQGEKRLHQVVLVDLGISPVVWKRLGVDYQPETFGSECLKVLVAE